MADAGSLLGQLIGAALGNGSVRGGAGGGSAPGGLGDILGQVLGGGAPAGGGQSGASGLPGGLGDILGQVLGGGSGSRGPGSSGGLPGGLDDILGQVLGGGGTRGGGAAQGMPGGGLPGGLGDILGQILGGGAASGGAAGGARSGGAGTGDLGDFASDALGGGGSAPAPGSFPAPEPFPAPSSAPPPTPAPAPQSGGGNDLVKYGGLAVIGMLAWNAFRKWQSQSAGRAAFTSGTPAAAGFAPAAAPGGADAFSGVLLSAMAAAAQADGSLDGEELERIGGGLARMGAATPQREELIAFLTTPVDPQQVVDAATSPESALQIYAASAMAIRPDSAVEQQYLASLAQALGIDPGLKAQVDADLGA